MKVRVLFFGATAAATDSRQVEICFEDKTSAASVFEAVIQKFPRLKNHKLLFAINQQYQNGDEFVCDGDELAIFTAVSGG